MSRSFLTSVIAIIILAGGTWYWWRNQPEQQINRQVDRLLDEVRFEKLSLRKKEDRHQSLKQILASEILFEGSSPLPNLTLSISESLSRLDEFHSYITLIDLTNNEATVELALRVKIASGPNFKHEQEWELLLDFTKGEHWKITRISGSHLESGNLLKVSHK